METEILSKLITFVLEVGTWDIWTSFAVDLLRFEGDRAFIFPHLYLPHERQMKPHFRNQKRNADKVCTLKKSEYGDNQKKLKVV